MKKTNLLFITIIILLIIALVWVLIPKKEEIDSDENISEEKSQELIEAERRRQEALIRWQTNCEADGGTWMSEQEMCYTDETALEMKESCELAGGDWLEDSRLYECEINGEVFQGGEWTMIEWDRYEEMKESCLDSGGEWLGGAGEACNISGDTFYSGKWLVLGEMEESCINEFGGEWLGGENTECKIDGVVYPGNWVQIMDLKDSCLDIDGQWLGGEKNQCQVNGQTYSYGAWKRIEEMKESCENIGGQYIGGDRFRCDFEGSVYFDGNWERTVKVPILKERCISAGGTWLANTRACQGLEKDWCDSMLVELDLGSVGWNSETLFFSFIFLFLLIAMLVFGHWQVRLQGKKIDQLQQTVVENSQRTNNIVNFINSSLANIE